MLVHAPEACHEPLELVEAGSERGVALRLLAAGRKEHEDAVAGHMVLALVVHPLHGHAPLCRSSLLVPLTCWTAYSIRSPSVMSLRVHSTSAGMGRNGIAEAAGMVLRARFSADSTWRSLEGMAQKKSNGKM